MSKPNSPLFWLDTLKCRASKFYTPTLIDAIIEAYGSHKAVLEARIDFFERDANDNYQSLSLYKETGLANEDVLAQLYKDHKADVTTGIKQAVKQHGDDVFKNGTKAYAGFIENPELTIMSVIEADELEQHPDMLNAVMLYIAIEMAYLSRGC